MIEQKSQATHVKYMLAGGSMVAAVGLLVEPQVLLPQSTPGIDVCQETVQVRSVLSRDELSHLLTLPAPPTKATIRQLLHEPYCTLHPLQTKTETTVQQEAYPLAFDPQTWLVVQYVGKDYVGYTFSFRH